MQKLTYLGYANHRAKHVRFGVRRADRFSHCHLIGATGCGKTTLLEQMVLQDILAGDASVIVIDPHGDLVARVRRQVPEDTQERVVFLDGADSRWTFNPLRRVPKMQQPLAVASLVSVFARQWESSWGPRVEHLLRNCLFLLAAQRDANLADVPRLLGDRKLQHRLLAHVDNEPVREFFLREWPSYSLPFQGSIKAPLLNKLGALLSDPSLRRVLCGNERPLQLGQVFAGRRVLLVDSAKGKLGEGSASLLGSLLLAYVALGGLARESTSPVFVYVDELGSVATTFVASMLEELRKKGMGLTAAHQHLAQLDPVVGDAVIGNAGTRILFRLGAKDAAFFEREFGPKFVADDLVNLPNFHLYLRLLVDGAPSRPFSAKTAPSLDALLSA